MGTPSYRIKFSNTAFRDLKSLDKKLRERILSGLILISGSPLDFKKDIKKLKGLGRSFYRLRVGEFRIIYFLSDAELIVLRIIDRKDLTKIINTIKSK